MNEFLKMYKKFFEVRRVDFKCSLGNWVELKLLNFLEAVVDVVGLRMWIFCVRDEKIEYVGGWFWVEFLSIKEFDREIVWVRSRKEIFIGIGELV